MYFAYFDESGDSGYVNSPSNAFALSAVLVHDRDWLDTLDQLVSFRRFLKSQFGVGPRWDLKANWLVQNKGPFKDLGLSAKARLNILRACLRFQRKCGTIRTFAIVINKELIKKRTEDARSWAWTRAIERLERFGSAEKENLHILPDEGHGYFIRRKLREMRRFHYVPSAFGTETLDRKAVNIVEDSSDRKSHESFFIQLADIDAYAAVRRIHPTARVDGSCWDELGDARVKEVNWLSGGPTGIVVWPQA